MPRQVFSKEEFLKLADGAQECLVVKRKGKVKIKLLRSRMMYVHVASEQEADGILKSIKIDKTEL